MLTEKKIQLIFGGIAIALLGFFLFTVTLSNYTLSKSNLMISRTEEVESELIMAIDWFDHRVESFYDLSEVFRESVENRGSTRLLLDELKRMDSFFHTVFFTTVSGENIITDGRSIRIDGRSREWYKEAVNRDIFISSVYTDALTKERVVTISRAILSPAGEMLGVLGVDITLDQMKRSLKGPIDFVWVDDPSYRDSMASKRYPYRMVLQRRGGRDTLALTFEQALQILFNLVLFVLIIRWFLRFHRGSVGIESTWKERFGDEVSSLLAGQKIELTRLTYREDHLFETLENKAAEGQRIRQKLKSSRAKVHDEKNFYHRIADGMPDFLWLMDPEGRILLANDKMKAFLAIDEGESASIRDVFPDFRQDPGIIERVLLSRDHNQLEMEMENRKTGEKRIVSTKTVRLFEGDEMKSVHGLSRDISEEKKLYDSYHESIRELSIIQELTQLLSGTRMKDVIDQITAKMMALLPIEGVSIRLNDGEGRLMLAGFSTARYDLLYAPVIDDKTSHLALCFRENRTLILNEVADLIFEEEALSAPMAEGKSWGYFPLSVGSKVFGVLSIMNAGSIGEEQTHLMTLVSQNISVIIEKMLVYEQLKKNFLNTVEALAIALEKKTRAPLGHAKRVADLARLIGESLNLKDQEIENIYIAGLLHQIGKFKWSDDALADPDAQFDYIQSSQEIAREIGLSGQICDAIGLQNHPVDAVDRSEAVPIEANILRIAIDFDRGLESGGSWETTFRDLDPSRYYREVRNALSALLSREAEALRRIYDEKGDVR